MGKETDVQLLDFVLQDAVSCQNDQADPLDLIMVSGDFVMHGISAKPGQDTQVPLMKETVIEGVNRLTTAFPEVPLLIGFGNNDVIYHNAVPQNDVREEFYAEVFDMWFTNVTANQEIAQNEQIKESFLDGGYYAYNISSNLTLITMNTLYFHSRDWSDIQGSFR